jgi:hypothetical protein
MAGEINHVHVEKTSLERLEALRQAAEELGGIAIEVIASEGEQFEFRGYQVSVEPSCVGVKISGNFPTYEGTRFLIDRTRQILQNQED